MVQPGQARVGLARELMENSRASYVPCGRMDRETDRGTDRETDRDRQADRSMIKSQPNSNTSRVNEV